FHRCKLRMLPLFAMINDFLEKAEEIMKIDCVVKEFSKGFPRFDIECIMNDDFKEVRALGADTWTLPVSDVINSYF
ncbi:hypothetical protein HPB47_018858, partial [Ixodes persulcatus]